MLGRSISMMKCINNNPIGARLSLERRCPSITLDRMLPRLAGPFSSPSAPCAHLFLFLIKKENRSEHIYILPCLQSMQIFVYCVRESMSRQCSTLAPVAAVVKW